MITSSLELEQTMEYLDEMYSVIHPDAYAQLTFSRPDGWTLLIVLEHEAFPLFGGVQSDDLRNMMYFEFNRQLPERRTIIAHLISRL